MTNYEKIKNMSIEEMAEKIIYEKCEYCDFDLRMCGLRCLEGNIKYLESEAE